MNFKSEKIPFNPLRSSLSRSISLLFAVIVFVVFFTSNASALTCAQLNGKCGDIVNDTCNGSWAGTEDCPNKEKCCVPSTSKPDCTAIGGFCTSAAGCSGGTAINPSSCGSSICCVPPSCTGSYGGQCVTAAKDCASPKVLAAGVTSCFLETNGKNSCCYDSATKACVAPTGESGVCKTAEDCPKGYGFVNDTAAVCKYPSRCCYIITNKTKCTGKVDNETKSGVCQDSCLKDAKLKCVSSADCQKANTSGLLCAISIAGSSDDDDNEDGGDTAFGIVPCGRTSGDSDQKSPCTLCHLFWGIKNIIDFAMKVLTFLAFTCLVIAGIVYIVSAGSDSLMTTAKTFIKNILFGFAIVLLAWLMINVVINYLGVKTWGWKWNEPKCDTTSNAETGVSTTTTSASSTNDRPTNDSTGALPSTDGAGITPAESTSSSR